MSLKKDLEERIKGLILGGADVIAVKEHYLVDRIMNLKLKTNRQIGMLVVKDFDDIKTLSEAEMNNIGWVRK